MVFAPKSHPKNIRIANPAPGGKLYTTWKRAMHYIEQGRAMLQTDGCRQSLFFITSDYRNQAAAISAQRLKDFGYDQVRRSLTREELHSIPFVGDLDRLMNRGKQRRASAATQN